MDFYDKNFVVAVRVIFFRSNHNHLLKSSVGESSCTMLNLSIMRKLSFDDQKFVALCSGKVGEKNLRRGKENEWRIISRAWF